MTVRAVSKLSNKTSLITPDLNDEFSILALINLEANEDLVSFRIVIFINFGDVEIIINFLHRPIFHNFATFDFLSSRHRTYFIRNSYFE